MAALDANVYKTPSFTELGMKKDKQVKDQRDFRAKETSATGAEQSFGAAQYELTGARKGVLQEAYNVYSEAAIKYEKSGSDADAKTMKDLANKVNFFSSAGTTMQSQWNQGYATAVASEFEGYAESPETIQQRYNQRINDKVETKTENGQVLIKEGDKFVPAEQSSYFSSSLNPNNSFIIPKSVAGGQFVLPSAYVEDIKGVMKSSSNPEQAIGKAESEFLHRLKNDASFRQDVGIHYAINELGLIKGKQGLSRADLRAVDERMQDEEFFSKATDSYLNDMKSNIQNTMGGSSIQNNPSYVESVKGEGGDIDVEMFTIDKVGDIVSVGVTDDGSFYISKQITAEAPPVTVKASESELAIIEKKLGVDVRGMAQNDQPKEEVQEDQPQQTEQSPVAPETEEVKQMLPKIEEAKGTEGDGLGLGISRQTGLAPPAEATAETATTALPEWYYNNLIKFEGGVSTDKDDNAWAANPDAPKVKGKRAHTNRGVQWKVFKEYAKRNKIAAKDWNNTFLEMTEDTAKDIVDDYASASGSTNFKDPILRSFFTQNSWGTGKVWAADFKPGRSAEYRSLLDWLQTETKMDFDNVSKVGPKEAAAIQEFYDKDPEGFIKTFASKKEEHFKTLDDFGKFGKGWVRRLKELESEALAAI